MLNLILAALPILGKLIPDGKTAEIVAAGTKVAQEVFGTTDEAAIVAKMEADPKLAEQFKAKLEAETATLRMQIEDTQDARATTVKLAEAGSSIAWGAPVVSVMVVFGFITLLTVLILRPIEMNAIQSTLLNVLLGYLGAGFQQVVNYYLGSSAGSATKDTALKQIAAERR